MIANRTVWLAILAAGILAASTDAFAQVQNNGNRKQQNQPAFQPRNRTNPPPTNQNNSNRPRTTGQRSGSSSQSNKQGTTTTPRRRTSNPGSTNSGGTVRNRTGSQNLGNSGSSTRTNRRTGNFGTTQPKTGTGTQPKTGTVPRKRRKATNPGTGTQPPKGTGTKTGPRKKRKTINPGTGTQPKTGTKTGPRKKRKTTLPGTGKQPKTGTGKKTGPRKKRKTVTGTGPGKKKSTGTLPGLGTGGKKRKKTGGGTTTAGKRRKKTGGSTGTLPGLAKKGRKTGTGRIVTGQRRRIPRKTTAQVRNQIARNRARELSRRLALARQRRTNLAITTRRTRDWQQWNRDYYSRYRWAGGRWGGAWVSRWDSFWERRWRRRYPAILAIGTTIWGMNRIGYQFGYQDYSNPYAGEPVALGGGATIDYSQPLCQPVDGGPGPGDPVVGNLGPGGDPGQGDDPNQGAQDPEPQMFVQARQAFMQGNYPLALSDVNAALKASPQDAMMHEFRALVLFAQGEYKQAAAPLNAVLAVGPGLDWKSLRGLYPDAATYTKQYRALEKHVTDNPKDAAAHFVLGYHYVTLGFNAYALKEFEQAAQLMPKDAVARQMVTMLSKGESKDDPNEGDQEKPLDADPPAGTKTQLALEQFTGTWTATKDKASFSLKMTADDKFTWTHITADGKKTSIQGVYAIKDGALALEPDSGGVMLANVSFKGDKEMNFKMVSDDDKDSGMTFKKS